MEALQIVACELGDVLSSGRRTKPPSGRVFPLPLISACFYQGACMSLCVAVVVIRQGVRAGVSALCFALPTFHLLLCLQVPATPWPLSLVVTSPHPCQADGSLARGSQLILFFLFIIPGTCYLSVTSNSNLFHFHWFQFCFTNVMASLLNIFQCQGPICGKAY